MNDIQNYWNTIENWLKVNLPEDYKILAKGIENEDIEDFEFDMGFRFPDDFKQFLNCHNGLLDSKPVFFDGKNNCEILSLLKIKLDRQKFIDKYLEKPKDILNKYRFILIPVIYYPTGDYVFLDVRTGELKIAINELEESVFMPNITHFMKNLAVGLETGRYAKGKYHHITTVDIDDLWDDIEYRLKTKHTEWAKLLEGETHSTPEFKAFIKQKFGIDYRDLPISFRTSHKYHDGQKMGNGIIHFQNETFVYLSYLKIIELYKDNEIPQRKTFPVLVNDNGISWHLDIQTGNIIRKSAKENTIQDTSFDFLDILLSLQKYLKEN